MTELSFEVFPPSTPAGLANLRRAAADLAATRPRYISVTYGAGGTQRDRSFDTIEAVHDADLDVTAHLTCVGQSRADVESVLERYVRLGIGRVVALRGDPPEGVDAPYAPHPDGFTRTDELVSVAADRGMRVAVSAYPERHPQSPSFDHDLDVLAAKVAAGADEAITQMFFDVDAMLRLRDRVSRRGIDVTLVPGIFPIHSFEAVARFANRCGASLPDVVAGRFAGVDDDTVAHDIAAELAAEHIDRLRDEGLDRFHLYTLNRSALALDVCRRIGHAPMAVTA